MNYKPFTIKVNATVTRADGTQEVYGDIDLVKVGTEEENDLVTNDTGQN